MKKSLLTIFLVVFIDLLGFGIIIPILPYYSESFGGTATTVGWLMACYSGMQFLFSPFWGSLSDKIGRRPVILITLLGISASMFLFGAAQSITLLFISRLLGGLFGGNISTASAYIADVTPPEKRAAGMAMIGIAFGLGFTFGPAIGGALSHWGYAAAGYFTSALALINFVMAFFILKEPAITEEIRKNHRNKLSFKNITRAYSNPKTGIAIVVFFLVTLGMTQLETSMGLYIEKLLQISQKSALTKTTYLLAMMGIIMVFIQGGGTRHLVKKYGEVALVILGAFICFVSLILTSATQIYWHLIVTAVIYAIGYPLINPSLSSLTSRNTEPEHQGATMGVYQSAGSLARVIGPVTAGHLFDNIGMRIPFIVASIVFLLAAGLTMAKRKIWKTS